MTRLLGRILDKYVNILSPPCLQELQNFTKLMWSNGQTGSGDCENNPTTAIEAVTLLPTSSVQAGTIYVCILWLYKSIVVAPAFCLHSLQNLLNVKKTRFANLNISTLSWDKRKNLQQSLDFFVYIQFALWLHMFFGHFLHWFLVQHHHRWGVNRLLKGCSLAGIKFVIFELMQLCCSLWFCSNFLSLSETVLYILLSGVNWKQAWVFYLKILGQSVICYCLFLNSI